MLNFLKLDLPWFFIVGLVILWITIRRQKRKPAPAVSENSESAANWSMPPELLETPTPRRLRFRPKGLGIRQVLPLALIGLALFGARDHQRLSSLQTTYDALQSEGARTLGHVVALQLRPRRDRNGQFYDITYSFQADGRDYQRTTALLSFDADYLRVGQTIPVIYLPRQPELSRLPPEQKKPQSPQTAWLVPLLMALIIGFAMAKPVLAERRILTYGRPARGVVTGAYRARNGTMVTYSFETELGTRLEGRTGLAAEIPVGTVITVIYLSDRPGQSAIYPGQFFSL